MSSLVPTSQAAGCSSMAWRTASTVATGGIRRAPGTRRKSLRLERAQVRRRNLAVTAALEVVAVLLAFVQAGQARALDGGDVDEGVLRTIIRLDEAEALGGVEEFYGAGDGHGSSFVGIGRLRIVISKRRFRSCDMLDGGLNVLKSGEPSNRRTGDQSHDG